MEVRKYFTKRNLAMAFAATTTAAATLFFTPAGTTDEVPVVPKSEENKVTYFFGTYEYAGRIMTGLHEEAMDEFNKICHYSGISSGVQSLCGQAYKIFDSDLRYEHKTLPPVVNENRKEDIDWFSAELLNAFEQTLIDDSGQCDSSIDDPEDHKCFTIRGKTFVFPYLGA